MLPGAQGQLWHRLVGEEGVQTGHPPSLLTLLSCRRCHLSPGDMWVIRDGVPWPSSILGGHPHPPKSPPWVSCPRKLCGTSPGPSPKGVSSTQRCSHDEDTPALETLALGGTHLAPRSRVWPDLGTFHPAPNPSSGLPHMSSALSSSHHCRWVTPTLLSRGGPCHRWGLLQA